MGHCIDGVVVKVTDSKALIRTVRNGDHIVTSGNLRKGWRVKLTVNELNNCVGQVLTTNDLTTEALPVQFPTELEEMEEPLGASFPDF